MSCAILCSPNFGLKNPCIDGATLKHIGNTFWYRWRDPQKEGDGCLALFSGVKIQNAGAIYTCTLEVSGAIYSESGVTTYWGGQHDNKIHMVHTQPLICEFV